MMARLTIWLRRVDAQIRFRASEITRRLLRKLIEIAITDLDLMVKFRGLMSSVEFEQPVERDPLQRQDAAPWLGARSTQRHRWSVPGIWCLQGGLDQSSCGLETKRNLVRIRLVCRAAGRLGPWRESRRI